MEGRGVVILEPLGVEDRKSNGKSSLEPRMAPRPPRLYIMALGVTRLGGVARMAQGLKDIF